MLKTSLPHPPAAPAAYDVRRLFREAAKRCPESVALRRGRQEVTYGELDLASDRVGAALLGLGAGRGAAVAVASEQPEDVICGVLGALKAGALFVPLDPRTPPRRLQAMLQVVAPRAFVVGEGLSADLAATLSASASGGAPGGGAEVLRVAAGALAGGPHAGNGSGALELAEIGPDDPCYLYFTSGSTGQPKAITGRFKSIAHFIRWEIETLGVDAGWRVSQLINPSFDAFLRDVFVPLCAGGTVCIPPDRDTVADARRCTAWLGEEGIHLVHCVPSFFRTLLHGEPGPLPSLRYVLTSGEPLLPADVKRWQERLGSSTRLVNLYGPSETTMTKFVYFVDPADGDRRTIPIGKPMPGARALVLDPHGKACPPRAVGEIHIRTPYRSLGYYGRPDLTAEVFVRNPFTRDPDDLIYRTGDLGRVLEDGNFEFLGRRDRQVKIRGVRIELAEIESLLLSHPGVRDAVVVDLANPDGTSYLCAYVVMDGQGEGGRDGGGRDTGGRSNNGGARPESDLRGFLAESLPEHSLPSLFLALEELPRTLSGKVDRRALPSPERLREARDLGPELPRSHAEEVVAGLFTQVLGLGQVGLHESFFELGGHSLLAAQVLSRVRSAFDVEVPLRTLFAHPTVAGLASQVEAAAARSGPPLATIASYRGERASAAPLSFGQERYWQNRQREVRGVPATNPILMALEGPLDVACLRHSLQAITDRHEVLRTSFRDGPAGPVQVVAAAPAVRLPLVDLERIAPARRWTEIRRSSVHEMRSPFDLERGPLMRTAVFRCSERENAVICTLHHSAFDGWSDGILVGEASVLYAAFRAGRPSPLRPLAAQYQDFARWQRQTLTGEALAAQVSFWREHLRGAAPVELAGDRPRPGRRTLGAGKEEFVVPEALERRLEEFAAAHGVTLFMTLLAAFKALLREAARQDDVVVTCLFANRDQAELEDLIGYFSAGLPLRTSGAATFRELLERVRAVTLAAHEHPVILYEPVLEGASFLDPGDRGGITSFRVMFQLAKMPPPPAAVPAATGAGEIKVSRQNVDSGWIGQDLTLFMVQSDRLSGRFRYSLDVLDRERAAAMRERFLQILAAGAADPDQPLAELQAAAAEQGGARR